MNKRVHFAEAPVTRAISPRPEPRTPSPVFSDSSLPDSEPGPSTPPSTSSFTRPLPSLSLKPDEAVAVHPYLEFNKYQKFTPLAWDVTTAPDNARVRTDRKGKGKMPLLPSDLSSSATHPSSTYMEIYFPGLPWKPLRISRPRAITIKELLDEVYAYLQTKVHGSEYEKFPPQVQQASSLAFYARCAGAKSVSDENEARVKHSGLRRIDVLGVANQFHTFVPVGKDTWQFWAAP